MSQEQNVNPTLIGLMRESGWTMRSIASVVILTFGSLMTLPAEAAIQQEIKQTQWHKSDATNAAKLSAKLEETHQFLTKLAAHDAKSLDLSASHAQVHALEADLQSLDKGAMDDFAANEAHIKAHKLPEAIEQRQQDAVKTYRDRMDTLLTELKAADESKDTATFMAHVNTAKQHLDQVQVKPFHEKFDPKNLPFSVAKPTGVKPRLSKKDYDARPVAPKKRAQVAANGSLLGILSAADVTGSLPASPSDPSYVAPTDDVQITPAIQAQAVALHNDPVQIFNWVHNNVEYVPTYGSIQGSDMTLQTLKGNDFDQASLLIALLRASNVPSRYVYGTIQVPIAQVENWVGGVTDPNAALNLMSQGGIPVTGLVQGGQIKYAQLEHVWVEAWVDFVPSRAAKAGTGNTWVPMDASLKQHTFIQATNLQQAVPFDAATMARQATANATVDPSTGAMSNLDITALQQAFSGYQAQLATYLTTLDPSINVSQIIGDQLIAPRVTPMFDAGLPYKVVSVGTTMTVLSANLQDKFSYELSDQSGDELLSYSASTPDLANVSLALSFDPATAADEALIASYLPLSNPDGSPVPISAFPSSLPGYLINVVPVLSSDAQIVAQGAPMSLGTALQIGMNYWDPQRGWTTTSKNAVAGEYHSVGLDLQGVSVARLNQLEAEMQSTAASLSANPATPLTKYLLVGDRLQSTIMSYFLMNDTENVIAARQAGVAICVAPSFGDYSTVANSNFTFGVPTTVEYPGYVMDIKHAQNVLLSKNGDSAATVRFNQVIGARYSALEGLVPGQTIGGSSPLSFGATTASALNQALVEGQPIYSVNSQNFSTVLPLLNQSPEVLQDIQSAVNAGLQVTISQSAVTLDGWSGVGYQVLDPATGTSGYEITGGLGGGASYTPLDIGDGFATFFHAPKQGLPDNFFSDVTEGQELEFFGHAFSFLSAVGSFADLLNHGCKVGAAIYLAGVDAVLSSLMTDALIAILALLPVFPLAGMILMILGLILIGYIMDALTKWEEDNVCKGPGP